jgi:hypothetical protein
MTQLFRVKEKKSEQIKYYFPKFINFVKVFISNKKYFKAFFVSEKLNFRLFNQRLKKSEKRILLFFFEKRKRFSTFPNKTRLIFDEYSQFETRNLIKIKINKRKQEKYHLFSFPTFLKKHAYLIFTQT